jgi:hypothetical protein
MKFYVVLQFQPNCGTKCACQHSHVSHDPPRVPHFGNSSNACPLPSSPPVPQPNKYHVISRIWWVGAIYWDILPLSSQYYILR